MSNSTQPIGPPVSRRSVLRFGTAVGISALATTGLVSQAAAITGRTPGGASLSSPRSARTGPLVLDYRPGQPSGWGQSRTVGGHVAAKDFTQNGRSYRVSLLPFGQSGDAPNPVYEDVPCDPEINFSQVLDEAFGQYYLFRHAGFRGTETLRVQSYSTYVWPAPAPSPDVNVGAELYVVYEPNRGQANPATNDDLHWIQVIKAVGPPLDNFARANPFYPTGGLTSIHGTAICNFYDHPGIQGLGGPTPPTGPPPGGPPPGAPPVGDLRFMAEAFLAGDTGVKTSGKDVITILGGIKWGWQVQELP